MLAGIGYLAAQYFIKQLRENSKVGISWGTGLHQLIKAMRPMARPDVEIIQLIGGTGSEAGSQIGPLLAPMLANTLGCTCRYIHAPLMMENESGRDTLLQEKSIRETLQYAEKCNIALVGIGSTNPLYYNPYKLGYMTDEEIVEIEKRVESDRLAVKYSISKVNYLILISTGELLVLVWKHLSKIEYVIGVAGGSPKARGYSGCVGGENRQCACH